MLPHKCTIPEAFGEGFRPPNSDPIRAQPIPHLINRESVILDNLMVITIRAGNRLRLRPLAMVRLVNLPRRVIHQLRQQIRVNRPRRIVLGIHVPIQFAIPTQPAADDHEVAPVKSKRARVTQTQPKLDQIKLKRFRVITNELDQAQKLPRSMLDSAFHCSNRSASSPRVKRLYSSR